MSACAILDLIKAEFLTIAQEFEAGAEISYRMTTVIIEAFLFVFRQTKIQLCY
jgi:hypothetical protein